MRWPRVRWRRVVGLLVALPVTAVVLCTQVPGLFALGLAQGEGVVLDTETQEPIADAAVILECRRRLLHGSSLVKYVATGTDRAGRYAFGFLDVARCDFGYVYPAKIGYVEVIEGQHSYEHVPERLYLTPVADARLRQLRSDHRMVSGSRFTRRQDQYSALYRAFYEAKRKAVTREEQDFVVEAYCRQLIELYRLLTPEEREDTRRYAVTSSGGRVDHEEEVEKWCRACR